MTPDEVTAGILSTEGILLNKMIIQVPDITSFEQALHIIIGV